MIMQSPRMHKAYSTIELITPIVALLLVSGCGGESSSPGFAGSQPTVNSQPVAGGLPVGGSQPAGDSQTVSGGLSVGGDQPVDDSQIISGELPDGDGQPVDGQTVGGGPIVVPQSGSQFSCSGNRLWGSIPDPDFPGVFYYISESFGNEVSGCLVIWTYDINSNCSLVFETNEEFNATLQGQSLVVPVDDEETVTLNPAEITVDQLRSLPDCPEAPFSKRKSLK